MCKLKDIPSKHVIQQQAAKIDHLSCIYTLQPKENPKPSSPLSLCLVLLPAAPAGEKKEQPDLYLSDINSQIFPSFELLPPQWLRLSFSSIFRSQSIAKKPWTKESHLLLTSSTPLLVSTHLLPLTTP